jgi:hypothetical protein
MKVCCCENGMNGMHGMKEGGGSLALTPALTWRQGLVADPLHWVGEANRRFISHFFYAIFNKK